MQRSLLPQGEDIVEMMLARGTPPSPRQGTPAPVSSG